MSAVTVGRIVHYKLSEQDVALIDQQSPITAQAPRNGVYVGHILPAIVVAYFGSGTYANLKVLLDGAGEYWATSRSEGDGPGTWAWPPRA